MLIFVNVHKKKKNKSGSQSVQLISKTGGKYKVIKCIGSSFDEHDLELLILKAKQEIERIKSQVEQFAFSHTLKTLHGKISIVFYDMTTFCIQGLDKTKDWKEVNEDLKDFIYYYFNSKYAKDDYVADNGEVFTLTKDTDRGKTSSFEIVMKYLRVVDDDLVGAGGIPKDNVKHLQGAVRLIRRSLTDANPALDLLNAFCLFYLGTNNNETLVEELRRSYRDGFMGFSDTINNHKVFWDFFEDYNEIIAKKANEYPIENLNDIKEEISAIVHAKIIRSLTNKYTEK